MALVEVAPVEALIGVATTVDILELEVDFPFVAVESKTDVDDFTVLVLALLLDFFFKFLLPVRFGVWPVS